MQIRLHHTFTSAVTLVLTTTLAAENVTPTPPFLCKNPGLTLQHAAQHLRRGDGARPSGSKKDVWQLVKLLQRTWH